MLFLTFNKLSHFKGKNQAKSIKYTKNSTILHKKEAVATYNTNAIKLLDPLFTIFVTVEDNLNLVASGMSESFP